MTAPNQVATRQSTSLATSAPPSTQGVLAQDVIIPRLLLMQGTSDLVKERKAQLGDMVRSTNAEKLGDPDKNLEFIPLSEPKATWIIENRAMGAQRFEFKRIEDRTPVNADLPWRFIADKDGEPVEQGAPTAMEWRRVKCLTLYALLPADIDAHMTELKKAEEGEMPDLSKALTPILITFRSTSFNAGKEVSTFFTQAQQYKQQGWKYKLSLGCFLDKNDQGTFYVFKVDRAKPTAIVKSFKDMNEYDTALVGSVQHWANIVSSNSSSLRVDDTGSDDDTQAAATSGNF